MLKKFRKYINDLINWMIWMTTFKMKSMSLYLNNNKLLKNINKVVLMMITPVAEKCVTTYLELHN